MTRPESGRLLAVLIANALLRIASSAAGALIGFYLAALAREGQAFDAGLVGALGVVVNVAEVAGAVPVGVLTDRWSPRALLVAGALLGAAATQIFGAGAVVLLFYLARALQGVATAAGGPALLAHLADVTRDDAARRGRVMGFYELSLLGGLALGGLLGGQLWEGLATLAFSALAAVYLLAAALFFWGAATPPTAAAPAHSPAEAPLGGLSRALRDPLLRRLSPAWLAMNAVVGLWLTHISFQLSGPPVAGQFLVGRFTPGQVGAILLGYAVVFGIGVTLWGFLLARMPRVRALRITIAAMLVASAWIYLLNSAEAWPPALRWALTAVLAFTIVVESGFTPAGLAYLADVAGRGEGRGTTMGIYTLLLGLGSALGAGLGGALANVLALNGLILGTAALALVAFFSLALLPAGE
jgi:MFS family permease